MLLLSLLLLPKHASFSSSLFRFQGTCWTAFHGPNEMLSGEPGRMPINHEPCTVVRISLPVQLTRGQVGFTTKPPSLAVNYWRRSYASHDPPSRRFGFFLLRR